MENKNGVDQTDGELKANNGRTTATWRSYNGPKLYLKSGSKTSNQKIFNNALAKALEGAANTGTLKKMQETIEANASSSNHLLMLFRNYQFKGIYDYDEKLATITKLNGFGPKTICPEDIVRFFKFDSTKRQFTEVETKQIGPTIIAISLANYSSK